MIYQDRRDDIWFGTFGHGLNRLRDGRITSYATQLGRQNNCAWWIHEDTNGVFWVGSEDGLNRFVPPGVEDPTGHVRDIASHKSEIPDQSRFFTFKEQHGLREKTVNNIQEDNFGCLWLSGIKGIYQIPLHELNEVVAGRRAQVDPIAYGEADGMLNSECNGGDNQPAGCKDRDGRIWFPTVQGVVVIDPAKAVRNAVPPPVVIEQVIANDRIVFGDGIVDTLDVQHSGQSQTQNRHSEIELPPGQARVVQIRYTANSLVAPEKIRFRYWLEGYDKTWMEADFDERVKTFTNLRPGNYTFRVTACNNHGIWSGTETALAFYVTPHFWQTWLFSGFCGTALIGLAAIRSLAI